MGARRPKHTEIASSASGAGRVGSVLVDSSQIRGPAPAGPRSGSITPFQITPFHMRILIRGVYTFCRIGIY